MEHRNVPERNSAQQSGLLLPCLPALPAFEIERRWLVPEFPQEFNSLPRIRILQGYLTPPNQSPEIRIRSEGAEFELTVKGAGSLARIQIPVPIHSEKFHELWPLTAGGRIEKERIRIPHGAFLIELDLYTLPAGFMSAEVEFPTTDAAKEFSPPPWFGREITELPEFRNRSLAQ